MIFVVNGKMVEVGYVDDDLRSYAKSVLDGCANHDSRISGFDMTGRRSHSNAAIPIYGRPRVDSVAHEACIARASAPAELKVAFTRWQNFWIFIARLFVRAERKTSIVRAHMASRVTARAGWSGRRSAPPISAMQNAKRWQRSGITYVNCKP